ncbi:acyl-CoA N-acyltransferase [Paraphoma chrysanthemicola]|nr:acyl-CoA N-acyltransferase [Paraphoma chrysanthemicola]
MAQQSTPAPSAIMEAQIQTSTIPKDAPVPSAIVTTSRLIIRHMHPKDAPSMSLSANSPAVAKYMTIAFPNPYTIDSANTWIGMNFGNERPSHFVICEASSPDVIIGGIGLKLGSDVQSHTAEVGFWIGEKHWGKGYTTEALEAFTEWSFEAWEGQDPQKPQRLERLWGGVFGGNIGSMRCFEKCDYTAEGVMKGHVKKHGETLDLHLFGLTKEDWKARQ